MWTYDKRLEFPVKISNPNPALANFIITQYGGPDGELNASMRYLSQRYSMPYAEVKATLTDIGSEVSVLTKNASQPAYLLDSQRCGNLGYIEVSKWRFLFKGKRTSVPAKPPF